MPLSLQKGSIKSLNRTWWIDVDTHYVHQPSLAPIIPILSLFHFPSTFFLLSQCCSCIVYPPLSSPSFSPHVCKCVLPFCSSFVKCLSLPPSCCLYTFSISPCTFPISGCSVCPFGHSITLPYFFFLAHCHFFYICTFPVPLQSLCTPCLLDNPCMTSSVPFPCLYCPPFSICIYQSVSLFNSFIVPPPLFCVTISHGLSTPIYFQLASLRTSKWKTKRYLNAVSQALYFLVARTVHGQMYKHKDMHIQTKGNT